MAISPSGIYLPKRKFSCAPRYSFSTNYTITGFWYSVESMRFLRGMHAPQVLASLYVVGRGQYRRIPACARLLAYCSTKIATMPREKTLRVRLSEEEFERLKSYAESTNRMVSEVIRDYIKKLPKKPS